MNKRSVLFVSLVTVVALATQFGGAAVAAPKATGNGWSSAQAISGVNQPDSRGGSQLNDVAVNPSGLTIAAWDQYSYTNGGGATIGAAVRSGGRWAAPFTISGTAGYSMDPRVAVGADGTMAVSWVHQDPVSSTNPMQYAEVAVKTAASSTWTTTQLATGPQGGVAIAGFVPIGIDPSGNVTAVWNLWDGTKHVVRSATLPSGSGSWTAPVTLSAPGADGLYIDLSVNAAGDAGVVYSLSPYTTYSTGTNAQYAFRSGPTGTWTAPVTASETLMSWVGYVTGPDVALDGSGLATVVYMGNTIEGVRQLAGGGFTSPSSLIAAAVPGSSYMSIDLGIDRNGNSVVAASIFDPTVNVDRSSVWVARGDANGAWTPANRLTDPAVPVDAYASRVAVSPDGTLALVGWIDHYHGTVQVSRLVANAWGPATIIGRGTAFGAFQEVLGLDAASGTVAAAVWKNAKTGTQTMASSYKA